MQEKSGRITLSREQRPIIFVSFGICSIIGGLLSIFLGGPTQYNFGLIVSYAAVAYGFSPLLLGVLIYFQQRNRNVPKLMQVFYLFGISCLVLLFFASLVFLGLGLGWVSLGPQLDTLMPALIIVGASIISFAFGLAFYLEPKTKDDRISETPAWFSLMLIGFLIFLLVVSLF